MTIEFYKKKRDIMAWKKDIIDSVPPKAKASTKKHLKIAKVKVVDSKKLDHAGGRKYGGKGRIIKQGDVGYVFYWKEMEKEAGLKKVR